MKRGIILLAAAAVIAAPAVAEAKKKPKLSPLEVQQMQSRDVEATTGVSFSAVMSVLQDEGYRIGSADKETGLITGAASTASKLTWLPFVGFGRSKKTPVVSAFIEEVGPGITKIRLNFVMGKASANQFGSNADEEPILDAVVYQDAFEKIQKAIFVKQAMAAPQPANPAPAPAPIVPAAAGVPEPSSAPTSAAQPK